MRALILSLALASAACGNAPTAPDAPAVARAAALQPGDARLALLYAQSCQGCHAQGAAGAPLTGFHGQWDARWRKGMPALLNSTVSGLNGMPAGGQCFSCTREDYEALIGFMAGRQSP